MKKILSRLLVFFIGVPLIIGIVVFLPHHSHAVLHVCIIAVSAIAAVELRNVLSHKSIVPSYPATIFLGVLPALVTAACAIFSLPLELISLSLAAGFLFAFIDEIFLSNKNGFDGAVSRLQSSALILLYPAYFITFIGRMTLLPNAAGALTLFLSLVFGCDSAAWLIGMLFGKGNRGFFKASPNKSIAGFIGGILCAIGVSVAAYYCFPQIFAVSIRQMIALAVIVAGAAIIGDLAESVIKRGANAKDSGTIMQGRGGMLDSIDSLLAAAPFYYIAAHFIFGP